MNEKATDEHTAPNVPPPALENGRAVGRWRIVGFLGRGGMAEVYEAEDEHFGAHYALKLFTYERGDGDDARRRFFAEGRLLARLDHPRLVRVYDIGEDDATGRPYFVMDLVFDPMGRPHTLADADVAGADEEQIAAWYEDLREGLAYIHSRGILHRDLKLQNVLVGADGHAVLSDFGVAKIFNPELREKLGLTVAQTLIAVKDGHKTVLGSVGYMAPEIELGVAASRESDWYALGVIVFKLLTGMWCDARTDVLGALETYNPVWRDILPKLLHANPAGREAPDLRALENSRREEEAYQAEKAMEELKAKRHAAVRGRRNAWIAAAGIALAAAALACVLQRIAMTQPPDFEATVPTPQSMVAADSADSDDDTPSQDQFTLARIDAWVLTHRLFADLKDGRITREKAVDELKQILRMANDEDLSLFSPERIDCASYSQIGETTPLIMLLQSAISNLTTEAASPR